MPASYTTGVVFLSEGAAEQRSSPANNASSHFAGSCPTTVHGLGTLSGERMHFHLPCPSRHLDVLLGRVARQPEDDRMSVELHLGGHLLPKRLGAGLWQDRGISEILQTPSKSSPHAPLPYYRWVGALVPMRYLILTPNSAQRSLPPVSTAKCTTGFMESVLGLSPATQLRMGLSDLGPGFCVCDRRHSPPLCITASNLGSNSGWHN
jgi:hypothetical protein